MTEYAVSYASALYELACEESKSKEILDDLNTICDAVCKNSGYVKLINAPDIEFKEKEKLLDEAFLNNADRYVLSMMKMLAKNRLFGILPLCRDEYEKSYNKDNNIEKATVISARELNSALKEKLEDKLCEMTKKTVVIDYLTDKSVLGGLVVRFSDKQIDASVRAKLEGLKERLSSI